MALRASCAFLAAFTSWQDDQTLKVEADAGTRRLIAPSKSVDFFRFIEWTSFALAHKGRDVRLL